MYQIAIKSLLVLVGIGAGAAMGWMSLRGTDWTQVSRSLAGMEWYLVVLALGAVLLAGGIDAVRWKLLLPNQRVSIVRLYLVKNTGVGVDCISPIRVFAELVQTAMLRYGNGAPVDRVVASVIMSRLFDTLVTFNLLGVGLILLPQLAGLRPVVLPLWGVTSAVLLGLVVFGKHIHKLPLVGRCRALESMLCSLGSITVRYRVMLACGLLTAASWTLIGLAAWLVARAVGVDMPLWLMAVAVVAVDFVLGMMPTPPGGIGVYEFVFLSTLGLFGIAPDAALPFVLVLHGMLVLPPILIGAFVLPSERHTLRQVVSAAKLAIRPERDTKRSPGTVAVALT